MPKGGALHLHWDAVQSAEWVIKNATYRQNCFMYSKQGDDYGNFHFFKEQPSDQNWQNVTNLRNQSENIQEFDLNLTNLLRIQPGITPNMSSYTWAKFVTMFSRMDGIFSYRPFFMDYWNKFIEYMVKIENIQYAELRGGTYMGKLYDFQRVQQINFENKFYKNYSHNETAQLFNSIQNRGKKLFPNFEGFKIIQQVPKDAGFFQIKQVLAQTLYFRVLYPNLYIGFDTAAEENESPLLFDLVPLFLEAQANATRVGTTIPFYFHAGETSLGDSSPSRNMYDAVLMNSSRIGHGFSLFKYPEIVDQVIAKDIAIEVNPIANQICQLVGDQKNHPANNMFHEGIQIVLSSDCPLNFGTEGVTYDWFIAIMSWDIDLASLKQLAYNSYRYSGMSENEKKKAQDNLEYLWNQWIKSML